MNARTRKIRRRADNLYRFFRDNEESYFTLSAVCDATGCDTGKVSQAAIRIVRILAEEDGWLFPPAVPQTDFQYVLTLDPNKLFVPTIHMRRIESGVRRTGDRYMNAMAASVEALAPERRPLFKALSKVEATKLQFTEAVDEMVLALVESERDRRRDGNE